jgi:transcription initiation protein SPT3
MTFVAGEASEPSVETTTVVENIVRDQTVQMVRLTTVLEPKTSKTAANTIKLLLAKELASRRGQTKFTTNDVLFQVRHNPGRLARLRNHMRWKRIRKRAKSKDDEAADDFDLDEVDDLMEDADGGDEAEAAGPVESDSDSSAPQPMSADRMKAGVAEASIPLLPWSVLSMFPNAQDNPALATLDDDEDSGRSELGPLPGSATSPWLLARLMKNDERTRGMTADEYTTWAECRMASFTYRKKKTFREWCGLGVIADHRAKDDLPEILGFLTNEWVQTLTEQALVVKEQETRAMARRGPGVGRKFYDSGPFSLPGGEDMEEERDIKDKPKSPIQPQHVRRAFEILQTPSKKYTAMLNGAQLMRRRRLRIF